MQQYRSDGPSCRFALAADAGGFCADAEGAASDFARDDSVVESRRRFGLQHMQHRSGREWRSRSDHPEGISLAEIDGSGVLASVSGRVRWRVWRETDPSIGG